MSAKKLQPGRLPGFPVNVPHVRGPDAVEPEFDGADDFVDQLLAVAEVVHEHIAADPQPLGQAPEGGSARVLSMR